MKEQQTVKKMAINHQAVGAPSFEDERTISTARPVVPLQHLKKLKHRRSRFLIGTFAVAILMGTTSGLVSAYFEIRAVSRVMQLDFSTAGESLKDDLASTVSEESLSKDDLSNLPLTLPTLEEQPPKLVTARRILSKPKLFKGDASHSVTLPPLSEDEALRRIREEVLTGESKRAMRRSQRKESDMNFEQF